MARRPLTIDEIDRMDRDEVLAYNEAREEELAREEEQKQEADDKARFARQFLAAGGNEADVDKEWKGYRRDKAAETARRADQVAAGEARRRISQAL